MRLAIWGMIIISHDLEGPHIFSFFNCYIWSQRSGNSNHEHLIEYFLGNPHSPKQINWIGGNIFTVD